MTLDLQTERINLKTDDFLQDPLAIYRELRHTQPVRPVTGMLLGDGLLATRYEDVETILRDDKRFANSSRRVGMQTRWLESWWTPKMLKAFSETLTALDDPDHRRIRGLVHEAFTPRRVREMEDMIEDVCHQRLDAAMQQPTFDLIASYALPVPLIVISTLMGVDESQHHKLHKWSYEFLSTSSASVRDVLKQVWNGFSMFRFFENLVEEKRSHPQDDLTSALVDARYEGEKLSDSELTNVLFVLLMAGHETSTNLIGTGMFGLLQHPDELATLKADPDKIPDAVDELLRWVSPVQISAPRYTLEDVELSGIHVPAKTRIYAGIASANHDETAFDDPDRLLLSRNPANKPIAFGRGAHYCLGAPLARMEAAIALRVLLERCPNLQLATDPARIPWSEGATVRGIRSMPVRCG